MRKPAFCICEIKVADQLRGKLYFHYIDSTVPDLLPKMRNFKPLAIFCGCTVGLCRTQSENHEERVSRDETPIWLD